MPDDAIDECNQEIHCLRHRHLVKLTTGNTILDALAQIGREPFEQFFDVLGADMFGILEFRRAGANDQIDFIRSFLEEIKVQVKQIFNLFKLAGGIFFQGFQAGKIGFEAVTDDMGEQVILAFKMIVDQWLGNLGLSGNL